MWVEADKVEKSINKELKSLFPGLLENEPLRKHTTSRVGGPARWFVEALSADDIISGVQFCREHHIPFFLLGNGSNVVFSDSGFDGLVISNKTQSFQILEQDSSYKPHFDTEPRLPERLKAELAASGFVYDTRTTLARTLVRADSGIRLTTLLKTCFKRGLIGLEWFAGIPGTVGGAVYMNIHGGPYFFGNFVHSATLLKDASPEQVNRNYFCFDYDYSSLHKKDAILLSADLVLYQGDGQKAAEFARNWARRKRKQPQRSAGCIFKNLTPKQQKAANLPSPSAGYVIDKVLNLKGTRCGDAVISPAHAAFIENLGHARALDFYQLVAVVQDKANKVLGFPLELEVEFIGNF